MYAHHNGCSDPNHFADDCDFDGDTILNIDDIDDDNDGILDTDECEYFVFTGSS